MEEKKSAGRPKGKPTCKPSLRCDLSDWESFKSLHKGKVNKMFNQWVKEQIKQD